MAEALDYQAKQVQAGSVFTPGSPVNERDLFAGRVDQLNKILGAASQRGYHAILYGERGVGKTSLSNILSNILRATDWIIPRVNCDTADTFTTLWKKAFRDIVLTRERPGMGFTAADVINQQTLDRQLPDEVSPDDVRRATQSLGGGSVLFVFDEFDRLTDPTVSGLMADTIKALSDYAVPATILLIGVADSVDELIAEHQSIERAIVQIPMPRMSSKEILQIVDKGLSRLAMTADASAVGELAALSQGLPYVTHLLAHHSVMSALAASRVHVNSQDVDAGIKAALEQWHQSIIKAYYDATRSSQPGNIYKEVLLACSFAATDEMGYFNASAVRRPLRLITGKDYDIPNFAQHLKNFSDASRGEMLERTGQKGRILYRFTSPLMRPYVVMKGFSSGLINRKQMQSLSAP